VRLQVSAYAAARLDDIWDYYATEASERVADRITKKIVDDIDWLLTRPRGGGGQYEPLLEHLGMGHRRKISGNYKIIYRIIDDLIFVSDSFDTRQDPEQMVW
jgi:plasmid stabilization system protein ParE